MEIRNLLTFIKVAEEQSLSKAAKQLGYAQSTVTMQMQQLEQELGVALYERVGKRIRVTESGHEFLAYADRIVRMSQEALQVGKGKEKQIEGTLRLGVADVLPESELAEWICEYCQRYPGVRLSVQKADGQMLTQMLFHNEIDLMMIVDVRIQDAALIHACEWQEPAHFFVSIGHPLGKMEKVGLEDVLQYEWIRGNVGQPHERNLALVLAAEGLMLPQKMEIDSPNLAIRVTAAGDGVVFLPDGLAREYVEAQKLEQLQYEVPGYELWQQTIYHKNKWLTGAMNAWIKMLEDTNNADSFV